MGNTSIQDNRRYPRVLREDSLSLTPIDPARGSLARTPALYASTVDISAAGMQVHITEPLPIRQQVDIWIVMADELGTFHLKGKINRILELDDPDEPEGFLAGIELLDDSPDMRAWRELF